MMEKRAQGDSTYILTRGDWQNKALKNHNKFIIKHGTVTLNVSNLNAMYNKALYIKLRSILLLLSY